MYKNKKLYYENKVKTYERELAIELEYVKSLQERIQHAQIRAVNEVNTLPNSEYVSLTKALNKNRLFLSKAENRVKVLRETIKRNKDLFQECE